MGGLLVAKPLNDLEILGGTVVAFKVTATHIAIESHVLPPIHLLT